MVEKPPCNAGHMGLSPSTHLYITIREPVCHREVSQVALGIKNLPANAGDTRDSSLIPGTGRSPGGSHGNPLQYSCLENPMDRGASWATVHRVAKSQTRLK